MRLPGTYSTAKRATERLTTMVSRAGALYMTACEYRPAALLVLLVIAANFVILPAGVRRVTWEWLCPGRLFANHNKTNRGCACRAVRSRLTRASLCDELILGQDTGV
jgi:hypothetical protein